MKKITLIVPCFNEEGNVEKFVDAVSRVLGDIKTVSYKIVMVDDGSTDGTLPIIKELHSKQKNRIEFISFSKNFGHQAALRAGLDYADGDAVISMDADLQHPPELLPLMIKKWQDGFDIVYTVRDDSNSDVGWLKKMTSKWFYRFINWLSGLGMDKGAADFRLIDKKVVNVIKTMPEKQLFLRGFMSWCGFKQDSLLYVPAKRFAGQSKYSMKKMIQLALQGITSFSIKPLRLSLVLGIISAIAGGIYGVFVIYQHFISHDTVAGWTSVIIAVLIMGGIQLCILGIIGEYLGRLFMQSKQRPDYIVREDSISE